MTKPPARLAVIAAARDCECYLPASLKNIANLAGCYDDAHFVFAVSDSSDQTQEHLEQWLGQGRKGTVLQLGRLEPTIPMRTMRIATARNACLEELQASGERFDDLLVVDLDDVLCGPISREAFRTAAAWLASSDERVAVTANSTPRYYDTWALRHERWCPYDVWHPIWDRPNTRSFEEALFREVFRRQIVLPPHLPPIPVASSFGGLALYKAGPALKARYQGMNEHGREMCEHVSFNREVTKGGGRMFIFPSLIVKAGLGHLYDPEKFTTMAMRSRQWVDRIVPPWRRYALAKSSG